MEGQGSVRVPHDDAIEHERVEVHVSLHARHPAGLPARLSLAPGLPAICADPQVRHRRMVVEHGGTLMLGTPIKLSETPASLRTPPPRFGEHTDAVLRELGSRASTSRACVRPASCDPRADGSDPTVLALRSAPRYAAAVARRYAILPDNQRVLEERLATLRDALPRVVARRM